jgi:two-component system OmpR family response regulator
MNDAPLKTSVLLIEDDDRLAQLIGEYLNSYEFNVTIVRRGDTAVAAVREHNPALVILDLMLPNMDGMEVCRRIRSFSRVPVLILTARVDVFDQIAGLETGADDYVIKPIEPRVLVARARALLRRAQPAESAEPSTQDGTLSFGELVISPPDRAVSWRGQPVELKTAESHKIKTIWGRGYLFSPSAWEE